MKIYSALYHDFAHLTAFSKDTQIVSRPEELEELDSVLILHGGQDISPSIYNAKVNPFTHASEEIVGRDKTEVDLAKRAIELGIPIYGICRGAQLVCALAGGTLVQHTNDHAKGGHLVINNDGKEFGTTSCHHQMMNPWSVEHDLIAWAAPSRSKFYMGQTTNEHIFMDVEPEVVMFPKIKALAVQGHPEWMDSKHPFVKYNLDLIKEKLLCNSTKSLN
mgnify:FL=1